MMADPRAGRRLSIYRPPPEDIGYRGAREAANCEWCRWTWGRHCREPTLRYSVAYGTRENANPHGTCERYSLTRTTKILRMLGLRAPSLLPEEPTP